MRPSNCIFCNVLLTSPGTQQPVSRTKEHVYARWYRDNVVHQKIKLFTSDGTTATLHRQPSLESFANGSVCADCNNGWMSALETQVEPLFQRLTSGTDIRDLNQQEIETLARWAGKTVIVLGYVVPNPMIIPEAIRRTFVPISPTPPHMRLFYAFIERSGLTLEGGHVNLRYGSDVPIIGDTGGSGYRFTLCIYNHCFTVDFPPILEAIRYDLTESCSAQIWPSYAPAGTVLSIPGPVEIGHALYTICAQIQVAFDIGRMRG